MRILFVDDEPDNVTLVANTLREALGAEIEVAETVAQAIRAVLAKPVDVVVCDVFVPPGEDIQSLMGPRARLPEGQQHLGGLLLLQELDRLPVPANGKAPAVLVHTACNEYAMVEVLKAHGHPRVPKPAPVDVLLRAVIEALDLPVPQ